MIYRASLIPFLTILLILPACNAGQKSGDLVDTLAQYHAGQYDQSFTSAVKLASNRQKPTADKARLIAGLSAYQLGDEGGATRYLEPLTDHPDRALSGPANAHLGLLYAKKGQHPRALPYFERATQLLEGNDLAQAHYHLALTLQKLGRASQAVPHLTIAASNTTDPDLKAAADLAKQTAGYTLQFGAYALPSNAQKRARQIASALRLANLGEARIVTYESAGRTLHHVQAGRFSTFEAASEAKRKLGLGESVSVQKLRAP